MIVVETEFLESNSTVRVTLDMILNYVIPLVCLALFNYFIYVEVQKTKLVGRSGSFVFKLNSTSMKDKEVNMTVMIFAIVLVFAIGNVFYLVIKILRVKTTVSKTTLDFYLKPIADLFITLKSSVTVIIYGIFSKKFRTIFSNVIRCKFQDSTPENEYIVHLKLSPRLPPRHSAPGLSPKHSDSPKVLNNRISAFWNEAWFVTALM